MVSIEQLLADVATAYAQLDPPTWPDPHPDLSEPREEEYSRVSDPERYRVVHLRARAWVTVLKARGARVEDPHAVPTGAERAVLVGPPRGDALPLLLIEAEAEIGPGESQASLSVAVADARHVVEELPQCGCDACDDGSEHLLEAIDEAILSVVGGTFVMLQGDGWQAQLHDLGESSTNTDHDKAMQICHRLATGQSVALREDTDTLVGHSWFRPAESAHDVNLAVPPPEPTPPR
ncbi:hypothetical protein ASG90_09390 [Nocardioides sp. Soil797]|nr:hypothetical protein ASG90_09390 [Nocardioides sp. Soil797]